VAAFFPGPGEDFLALCEAAVEDYAPEHLELHLAGAREFLPRVRCAGAVFLGGLSATAFGDYVVGSNHVLPTGGSARFSSALSVQTFLRRRTHVEMSDRAVEELTPRVAEIADSEGLYFHRLSAEMRLDKR
jgi:histidinol dehydrogenase